MSSPIYHNPDQLTSPGDPPWRFLVRGEEVNPGDHIWAEKHGWVAVIHREAYYPAPDISYRTQRPLPAAQPPASPPAPPQEVELIHNFLLPVLEPWCLLNQIREKSEQLAALLAQHRSARVKELEDALASTVAELEDAAPTRIAAIIFAKQCLNPPTQ